MTSWIVRIAISALTIALGYYKVILIEVEVQCAVLSWVAAAESMNEPLQIEDKKQESMRDWYQLYLFWLRIAQNWQIFT